MTISNRVVNANVDLRDVPELSFAAVEAARRDPAVGCLIDRVYPGRPLLICFAFRDLQTLAHFDFFGRSKKLEKTHGVYFNRILLRDVFNSWYHRGVPGLGRDVDEVRDSLRGLIDAMQPQRVFTIGQSMGGYAAIMFGMLLRAAKIVAFGPLSHLDADLAIRWCDTSFYGAMESLRTDPPGAPYHDLLRLGRELEYQGELNVIFGTHPGQDDGVSGNFDAVHALRLAQLPSTFLDPYPEADHPIAGWLIDHGKMDGLLSRLLIGENAPRDATDPST